MSPSSFWTPIKFTVSSSIPNCSCSCSSQHHEYAKNRLLSLPQTRIYGPINLVLPSLDGRHWSVCHIIQMQYLRLFFSAGSIASSFTAETHFLEYGFVWCNNCKTTCHFQYVLLRTSNRLFPYFQRPLYISDQEPLKCLVSCLLTFQQCHFKLPMGPRSRWYL